MKRQRWYAPSLGGDSATGDDGDERWVEPDTRKANLIGSTLSANAGPDVEPYVARQNCAVSLHMPVLDIDHRCHLKESETPGHFHLFIDVPMKWTDYEKLVAVMGEVGILEPGYVSATLARKASFVARRPWKEKSNG